MLSSKRPSFRRSYKSHGISKNTRVYGTLLKLHSRDYGKAIVRMIAQ